MTPTKPREPDISLPLELLNKTLMFLGKQPFEQVADLIIELRNTAGPQIEEFQREMRAVPGNGQDRPNMPA